VTVSDTWCSCRKAVARAGRPGVLQKGRGLCGKAVFSEERPLSEEEMVEIVKEIIVFCSFTTVSASNGQKQAFERL
jgi:hypothetical protein